MEAAKSSTDTRECEAPLACGPFPGLAEAFCEGSGKAELGVGGNDEPGPAVCGGWLASSGAVHPNVCLNILKMCSRSNTVSLSCAWYRRDGSSGVGRVWCRGLAKS